MTKRLEQAEHNEKLSQKLFDEKVFLDWANTTAFYSALHYVHHKLLPGEFNGKKCDNIDDVLKSLKLKGKHEATNQMVQKTYQLFFHLRNNHRNTLADSP